MTNIEFGQYIRDERLKIGWSQQGLADCVGVYQTDISQIEKGLRGVSIELASRILYEMNKRLKIGVL